MTISTQDTSSMNSERLGASATACSPVRKMNPAGSLLNGVYAGKSLIDPMFDHDSCGVGFVATVDAVPTHEILQQALTALGRLAHRGAVAPTARAVTVLA